MSGIGAVERFVAQGKVGNDVAFDHGFQQRPLKPGRVAQMAARDPVNIEADPRQHIAAKCLRHPETFAYPRRQTELRPNRTVGQSVQELLDQSEALLDLADADPDAGVDVAALEDGNIEGELTVRPVSRDLARVEGAAAGTPDVAASAKLPCQRGAQD